MNTKQLFLISSLLSGTALTKEAPRDIAQKSEPVTDVLDLFEEQFTHMQELHERFYKLEQDMFRNMEEHMSSLRKFEPQGPSIESFTMQEDKKGNLIATIKLKDLSDEDRERLQFDVQVEHDMLKVTSTLQELRDEKERKATKQSSFTLIRSLPTRVSEDSIKASFNKKKGALIITMSKHEPVKVTVVNE